MAIIRPPSAPASDTNFARRINHIRLDVHNLIPRTKSRLFIPGMPTESREVEEDFMIDNEREAPLDGSVAVDPYETHAYGL